MILNAFNSLISRSTLTLEEAKGQIRDSVEKEFKKRIQQELPTPDSIKNILQSQTLTTNDDLQKLSDKFIQLKDKCKFLEQQVDSKTSQINSIKDKTNKIKNSFSKLDDTIKLANDFLPTIKKIINIAPGAIAALGGIGTGLAIVKLDDGLKVAKGKVGEFESITKVLDPIKDKINNETNSINNQIDTALEALTPLKTQAQQICNYADTVYLQSIAQFSGLLDSDTISTSSDIETTRPVLQFKNPEEILNNLENSNKDKFIEYLRDIEGNTGYRIIKK